MLETAELAGQEINLKPDCSVTFFNGDGAAFSHQQGAQIGRLDFTGPTMTFEGEAEASALVFFDFVAKSFEAHIAALVAAQCGEMQAVISAIVAEIPHRSRHAINGNAPGHAHRDPGIWDSDNGPLAGKECGWCKAWAAAVALDAKAKGGEA